MITVSNRLMMAANMVRSGVVVADIGTDHAYLPSYLVMSGKIPRAIACDLRQMPLENARETVERYNISDKIELRLSDGLDAVKPNEVQDIIIAGMGGTLTAQILERAQWLKDSGIRLILQPMTHAEDVRAFLCENGFEILKESACEDEGRVYISICAEFTGCKKKYPAGYEFYGELDRTDDLSQRFVKKQYVRIKKRADSLRAAGIKEDEAEYCEAACNGIERFLERE
ncbi:MAG: SAM-dependent methyltransferase [Clostridia bacterium]|nr:SAM-dependent methyltransferase [Clostridia bacterium]